MSTSHTQWADLSTSQVTKRTFGEPFASEERIGVNEQQPELPFAIQRAIEQERHRIAENLHDSVAQDVALALHKLEHIQYLLEQSQLYQAFQEVTHVACILENGLHSLRGSIETWLPQQFDQQTAFASLLTLIQKYQQNHPELQLDFLLEPHELLTQLPPSLEVLIFHFVQEALNNIWQHACATHIVLTLSLRSNVLTIEVCDDGHGFSPQAHVADNEIPAQFGLRIMRGRIEHMGGSWQIESQPGGGTCVRAVFPLEES